MGDGWVVIKAGTSKRNRKVMVSEGYFEIKVTGRDK